MKKRPSINVVINVVRFFLIVTIFAIAGLVIAVANLEIASLSPSGITWLTANSSYEFTSNLFEIRFNTPNSIISQVNVSTNGGQVAGILNPSSCTTNGTFLTCNEDFDILTVNITSEGVSSVFGYDWTIVAVDNESGVVSKTLGFTVKNDVVDPTYTLSSPSPFAIQTNGTIRFNISVIEEESGFNHSIVHYDYVNVVGGKSEFTNPTALSCANNICTGFIEHSISDILGYYYEVVDKAGNKDYTSGNDAIWHYLYIDNRTPLIGNLSPAEGVIISSSTQDYGFNFSDDSFVVDNSNFDPTMNCTVFINGSRYNSSVYDETKAHTPLALGASLSGLADGYYHWQVTCTDVAGWSTSSSSRTFTFDNTGPVISLANPANGTTVRNGTTIDFTIIDFPSSVSRTLASLNGGNNDTLVEPYHMDTSIWPSGGNVMVISANDTVGNPSKATFSLIIDNTPPMVALQQPVNNSFGSGTFTAIGSDDFSSSLSCSLQVDGSVKQTKSVGNATTGSFSASLADGNHGWLVNCTDTVGNTARSEMRKVIIDTEKPIVVLTFPINSGSYDANNINTNGLSDFNYTTSDNIAVGSCQLYVNTAVKTTMNGSGNVSVFNFTEQPQNAPYGWLVQCNDTAGNSQNSSAGFLYHDTTAPAISSLSYSSVDDHSAIIAWTIDETANNTVYYGMNKTLLLADPGSFPHISNVTREPRLSLGSLSASSTYFYLVASCDQFGQCSNNSATIDVANFSTLAAVATASSSGSGGGASASPDQPDQQPQEFAADECDPLWRCEEWSSCQDGQQTRRCEDWALCGVSEGKPDESQICTLESTSEGLSESGTAEFAGQQQDAGRTEAGAPGVGQAGGIFSQIKSNWKPLAAAGAVLLLLGLALWRNGPVQRGLSHAWNYRKIRREREEAEVRNTLREGGLIE